jgi:hypothetical protein
MDPLGLATNQTRVEQSKHTDPEWATWLFDATSSISIHTHIPAKDRKLTIFEPMSQQISAII